MYETLVPCSTILLPAIPLEYAQYCHTENNCDIAPLNTINPEELYGTVILIVDSGLAIAIGKYTEAASGIFMVMVCGGGLLPLLQGGVADSLGFLSSYWVIFIAFAYMLYYALIGCKNVNKNIPVE